MQAIGFASMAFGMLLLVIAVRLSNSSLHIPLVFVGFILFNLLMNAGPNSTTFTLAPIFVPDAVARDGRWIRGRRRETRRNVGRFPSANRKRKIRASERSWNGTGCRF